jgi:hypothetical protein
MKWILLLAALLAAILAIPILLSDVGRLGRRPAFASLASAILWLALLVAGLFLARSMGWFSIPVVAVIFLPLGLSARWALLATRRSRDRLNAGQAPPPPLARQRFARLLAWPLLLVLAIGAMALGAAAAVVASWR